MASYHTRFAIYCSCHLEMKEWTGLSKPLAGWRMDAEQKGIETGKEDSTGEKGGNRMKLWMPSTVQKVLRGSPGPLGLDFL